MTVLLWDPATEKYRSSKAPSLRSTSLHPAPRTLPPIWPPTPEWYPEDDRYRGEP